MLALSQESILFSLESAVAVAGIGWIGLHLYVDGREVRTNARASWWWLRWCSMLAFVGSWAIVTVRSAGGVPFRSPSMTLFMSSTLATTLGWFHVWFLAWPGVQIGSDDPRIGSSMRSNMVLFVPAVFFFYASSCRHDLGGNGKWIPSEYWLMTAITYAGIAAATMLVPNLLRSILAIRLIALGAGSAMIALTHYL